LAPGEPSTGQKLIDGKGRVATKLRISVTDRCNFACLFCMPEKDKRKWIPSAEILSFDEIERVSRVFASMGVSRIRITGGEPLLRRGLEALVARLTSMPGIEEVDMTTNGWFLEEKAKSLKDAGLDGVSVSLHSLKPDRFARISGMDALPKVLRGLEESIRVGLSPIKVNSVAIRGYNDDEILDIVDYAHSRGLPIRFIEFMPLDGLGIWSADKMVPGKEILQRVSQSYSLAPLGRSYGSTASLWRFRDGPGELGLIMSMTEPFCDDCDRVRLTADGKLLSCLFDTQFYDLKPILRSGEGDEALKRFMAEAFKKKPDGVGYMPWIREGWEKPRNMHAIGG
jgi:cyclic pyranopterin phosphate synthase